MKKKKRKRKFSPSRFGCSIVTIIWIAATLFPLLWMVSSAFKDSVEIYDMPPKLLPKIKNELVLQVEYDEELTEAEIRDAVKFDFVNLIYGYDLKFDNFNNGGIYVYGLQGNKVIATAHMRTPEIDDVKLGELFTNIAEPKFFEEKMDYLFENAEIEFLFDRDDRIRKIRGRQNEITTSVKEFYNSYGLKGTVKEAHLENSVVAMFNSFVSAWLTTGKKLGGVPLYKYLVNSIIVTVLGIGGQMILSSLGGYALSKLFSRKASQRLILLYLATMMVPATMTLIPRYELFKSFGLLDTYTCLYLNCWFAPMTVYFFKGFFDGLPKDLFDAAHIDGASQLQMFVKITVPLSKSVFAALVIMDFIPLWNEFMWPFITTKSPELYTYAVALYKITYGTTIEQNVTMALSCIAAIPTFVVFVFFQKYIEKGIVFSGIKG